VLVVTSEHLPLAFFDAAAALDRGELVEDELVRYELCVQADIERLRREVEDVRAELRALHQTKAWRLMQPARRAYSAALRTKRRGRDPYTATDS
jgi:hypothetical protein